MIGLSDKIVSIRVNSSLIEELRQVASREHYLDLSEFVRSILREKWMAEKDPYIYEIKKLRKEIKSELHDRVLQKSREELLRELEAIKKRLKDEL